jgi:valyl-tRNA synthetase
VPIPGGTVEVLPNADLDLEAAGRKLEAERSRLDREIELRERKLANSAFVEKAPAEVVQKVRDELALLRFERDAL